MDSIDLEWDVYQQQCPSRLVMERIADKWVLLILGLLEIEPARFNELLRRVEGISKKSLTETLRSLQRDGLVHREVITASPIAVRYSITPLGRTLGQAAEAMRLWSQQHMDDVLAARERYDED